jgi:hypothetical protein
MMGYKRPAPGSVAIAPEYPLKSLADERWVVKTSVEGLPGAVIASGVAAP